MNAAEAVALLVERARARQWGLAAAAIVGDEIACRIDSGDDPIDEDSLFQVGSVTKTMTAVLFADTVRRGETTPTATIGEVLDLAGAASAITLAELATHHSGLPRLPANLSTERDPGDPYAGYTREHLLSALASAEVGAKVYAYSNFGFMSLGAALARITGTSVPELWQDRIFGPLQMSRTGCPGPTEDRLRGYAGSEATPWWTTETPGAGGVGTSLRDMARYLRAHVTPPASTLGAAIESATTVHSAGPPAVGYGWHQVGGSWWHNGATHGFQSFVAFHRPTQTGVVMLANTGDGAALDDAGTATLTTMVRARL